MRKSCMQRKRSAWDKLKKEKERERKREKEIIEKERVTQDVFPG